MRSIMLGFLFAFVIAPAIAQKVPVGRLGYALGVYLKIEGIRVEGPKTGGRTLLVDTVNGKKLATPTAVAVENVKSLPESRRCILKGYETGGLIGVPPAVEEAAKEDGRSVNEPQAGWQFHRWFVALSVVEPTSAITLATPVRQWIHLSDLNPLSLSRVVGCLGEPLGTRLTIGGVLAEHAMLPNALQVSETSQGTVPLAQPLAIEIRGQPQLQKGVRYRLEGYEAGEFSGPPDWQSPQVQQPFQFRSFFVVTTVIEPKAK